MNTQKNLYDILNSNITDNITIIKKNYHKLAMKYHPDKNNSPEAEDIFKEISMAYDILSDPDKKNNYDKFGINGLNQTQEYNPFHTFNVNKFFFNTNQYFNNKKKTIGPNIIINAKIPLKSFYNREKYPINFNKNIICTDCFGIGVSDKKFIIICNECNGEGKIFKIRQQGHTIIQTFVDCNKCNSKGKTLDYNNLCSTCKGKKIIKVPKVININLNNKSFNGEKIIIKNQSNQHPDYDKYGDIIIILNEIPDKYFIRKNNDLYINYNISLVKSLCGGNISFNHLDNKTFTLSFNNIIKPNSEYKINNLGMYNTGNLFIKFNIIFPNKIPEEYKKYLIKLLPSKNYNNNTKNNNIININNPISSNKNNLEGLVVINNNNENIDNTNEITEENNDNNEFNDDIPPECVQQ